MLVSFSISPLYQLQPICDIDTWSSYESRSNDDDVIHEIHTSKPYTFFFVLFSNSLKWHTWNHHSVSHYAQCVLPLKNTFYNRIVLTLRVNFCVNDILGERSRLQYHVFSYMAFDSLYPKTKICYANVIHRMCFFLLVFRFYYFNFCCFFFLLEWQSGPYRLFFAMYNNNLVLKHV